MKIDDLSSKDQKTLELIEDSTLNLHLEWRIFRYFFVDQEQRVDVLNEASGLMASVLQFALLDRTLVRLRALTDPAFGRSSENISVQHLVSIATRHKLDLTDEYEKVTQSVKRCRRFANKRIVHHDYREKVQPQKAVTIRDITDAVNAVGNFVKIFNLRLLDQHLEMHTVLQLSSDHQEFLRKLILGNEATKQLKQKMHDPALSEDDWMQAIENYRTRCPDWVKEANEDNPF